jgi:ABC-2 type transport system ATP-binding protein
VSTQPPVLDLNSLSKSYGTRLALDDVTLRVEAGITGLLGPNGSGKSTMIKSILGLLRIQSGTATVMGFQLPQDARQIRDAVGYLPEDDCFIAGLSGVESVRFMAELSGLPGMEALRRSHEALDFADVGQERYRNVETYSTGMRQKLKFAQAIVHDPEFIILDEPTSGLDPEQRIAMLRKIRNLAHEHGKSILISTHILHDVKTVCRQVVIMSRGKIRLVDTLENLSRPTRSGVLVELDAREPATAEEQYPESVRFAQCLSQQGYEVEERQKGTLWVSGVDDSNVRLIWQKALEVNVTICGMGSATNSLEEVFFNAVKEAEHATA